MIDVKISAHEDIERFEVSGAELDIAAEIGCLIGRIYAQSKVINPKAAERFRAMIGVVLLPDSSVWSAPPMEGNGVIAAVIPCGKREEGPGR